MRKLMIGVVAILFALLLVGGGAWLFFIRENKPSTISFNDEATGLSGQYHVDLSPEALSTEEKDSNFFLRLENDEGDVLIRFSYETGLRAVTAISKTKMIPTLLSNTEKSLPKTFPNLKIEDKREFSLKGREAGEIVFSYQKTGEKVVKRRLIMINKDDNTVTYIAAEAGEEVFTSANIKYFSPLVNSLSF